MRTRLIASLVTHNELSRYLEVTVESLLEYVDEIRVLDDRSTDGTGEWLADRPQHERGLRLLTNEGPRFFEHEGHIRNKLLDFTLAGDPTHVLAIDADEIVTSGYEVRREIERNYSQPVWSLCMEEVWKADAEGIYVRTDGGWQPHAVPILYAVPERMDAWWRIRDRALACGREPEAVSRMAHRARPVDASVLHLGWANEGERQARYDRYATHDGGKFHANAHLQSILWPDSRVRLKRCPWPAGLASRREGILERVNR